MTVLIKARCSGINQVSSSPEQEVENNRSQTGIFLTDDICIATCFYLFFKFSVMRSVQKNFEGRMY